MDEDEDAEEKRRRMEAKIAAENFGAAIGFAAGAALAMKEKLDEHAAREEQAEAVPGRERLPCGHQHARPYPF